MLEKASGKFHPLPRKKEREDANGKRERTVRKQKAEKNYAGNEKPLPTLIKEKEPIWYRVP